MMPFTGHSNRPTAASGELSGLEPCWCLDDLPATYEMGGDTDGMLSTPYWRYEVRQGNIPDEPFQDGRWEKYLGTFSARSHIGATGGSKNPSRAVSTSAIACADNSGEL
jgi:hypothetical protein